MREINYNVLNTLNLMCQTLGDAYLKEGYNPFDSDFIMTIESTKKLLEIPNIKEQVKTEDFLEKNDKDIISIFQTALINTNLVLGDLEMNNKDTANSKLKEIRVFLKNRSKLLQKAIEQMQNSNANAFALYKDIVGINLEYSEIIKKSFYNDFNAKIVIQNFLNYCFREEIKDSNIEKVENVVKIQSPKLVQTPKTNTPPVKEEIKKELPKRTLPPLPPKRPTRPKPEEEIIKE